jgi:pimeloyl-ACP methyl ester carboxylesterase
LTVSNVNQMKRAPKGTVGWSEASASARKLFDGVTRGRIASSEPGVELSYLDWGGSGELVTIHHANGFCAATYARIAVALRDRYRVIAVDARGHGDSTPVSAVGHLAAYDWSRMARDYAVVLEKLLEVVGRDCVRCAIGHSFGGSLTLGAAAESPGLIEEALLVDPVVLPPIGEFGNVRGRGPDLASNTRRRRSVYPTREDAYAHFAGRGLFANFQPEALALYVSEGMTETPDGEIRLKCDPEAEAAVFENGRTLDTFGIASKIETRTRIIHAARGDFSLEVYEALASRMPDAQVESFDVGHLVAMEEPQIIIDHIRAIGHSNRPL